MLFTRTNAPPHSRIRHLLLDNLILVAGLRAAPHSLATVEPCLLRLAMLSELRRRRTRREGKPARAAPTAPLAVQTVSLSANAPSAHVDGLARARRRLRVWAHALAERPSRLERRGDRVLVLLEAAARVLEVLLRRQLLQAGALRGNDLQIEALHLIDWSAKEARLGLRRSLRWFLAVLEVSESL